MRKVFGLLAVVVVVGCGPGRAVDRTGDVDLVDEVAVKRQALSSTIALTALGLDPATSSISFGESDPAGYDVLTTTGVGFPTEGDSYLVLSSGTTSVAYDPNSSGSTSYELGGLNTNAGQDLVQATVTTPVPAGAVCFLLDWKFLSEEYPEWVGTQYNDAFLVEVGSSTFSVNASDWTVTAPNNVAYDADGELITINTTGALGMTPADAAGTTYDGATTTLTTQAPIAAGLTSLTLIFSVMDLGDSVYDSTVFIDNIHFSGSPCGEPITTPWLNKPPTLAVDADSVSCDEGSAVTNSGTFDDLNGDDVALTASIGTVVKTGVGTGTWSWSYTPADGPATETVTVFADDGEGGTASIDFTLEVLNVAPSVGAITAPLDPVPVGVAVTASAPFTDPGTLDTHTGEWDWGDGTTSPATIGGGTATDSHVFAEPGIYTLTVTVTDKDGGVGSSTFRYLVVYDPSAGFVTGGGWISSPAGAYVADPTLTGKANFGFVARYKKGATVPGGNTQFQFHAGNLNFHSTAYSWLVVAGARAVFKGVGTINGTGSYGFMLSAVDGQLPGGNGADKFRIKIWDSATDVVVYDNQVGAADDADPTTVLGGGSITIHK